MKTYQLLRILSWLSGYIHPRLGNTICSLVGGILFYVKPTIRRAVMANMRHVFPSSTQHQRRTIARRVIRNNLKNYYDLLRLRHLNREELDKMVVLEGMENLEAATAAGKGAILFSGHIGNFNVVPQLTVTKGYNAAVIAEDIKPEKLYQFVNHMRAGFGLKFIRAGSSEVRTVIKLLRSNGVLLLAADRDVSGGAVPVQFFDGMVDLPAGPVVLAQRTGAALVPALTVRTKQNTHLGIIYPALQLANTGNRERDVETNMRMVAQTVEKMILRAPDQWTVLQPVWDEPSAPPPLPVSVLTPAPSLPPSVGSPGADTGPHSTDGLSEAPASPLPTNPPDGVELAEAEERSPSSV